MKPKRDIFLIAAVTVILLFGVAIAVFAATGDPGSAEDPLVTKSYVDTQINSMKAAQSQWQVVDLTAGQRLEAQAGAEIIVRVGTMAVIDPNNNGIPDLSTGTNIAVGRNVTANHLLIVPRTDGRGLIAKTKVVLMYKGDVTIK